MGNYCCECIEFADCDLVLRGIIRTIPWCDPNAGDLLQNLTCTQLKGEDDLEPLPVTRGQLFVHSHMLPPPPKIDR